MRGLAKYVWVLVALFFVGGFLLYETSGLMGRTPVTATTAVVPSASNCDRDVPGPAPITTRRRRSPGARV